jgi:hypothetical protein
VDQERTYSFYRILLLILISAALLFIFLFHVFTGTTLVPSARYPPFADLSGVTSAVDCYNAGQDPYTVTSFDPVERHYDYPRIWLKIFSFFNLGSAKNLPLALVMISCFVLLTIPLFRIRNSKALVLVAALLLSPPILLLLERANNDLIIYPIILIAIFYLSKVRILKNSWRIHITAALLIVATIFKYYPIFLFPVLLFENISRRTFFIILGYSALALSCYFTLTFRDVLQIAGNTPKPSYLAYGRNVLLQDIFPDRILNIVTSGLMLLTTAAAWLFSKKQIRVSYPVIYTPAHLLFISGILIYAGTFFLGNNFSYRLVFLLLTIPFLINGAEKHFKPKLVFGTLLLVILLFFGSFDIIDGKPQISYLIQGLNVAIAWTLLFLLTAFFFSFLRNRVAFIIPEKK